MDFERCENRGTIFALFEIAIPLALWVNVQSVPATCKMPDDTTYMKGVRSRLANFEERWMGVMKHVRSCSPMRGLIYLAAIRDDLPSYCRNLGQRHRAVESCEHRTVQQNRSGRSKVLQKEIGGPTAQPLIPQ
jgi:hypothetical protein